MSTAVSFLEVNRHKNLATTVLESVLKPSSENISVSPDYRNSVLWVNILETAPLHISPSLLGDLLGACNTHKGLQASPFRFRVLTSKLPGTFCLGGDLNYFRKCIARGDRNGLAGYALDAVTAVHENSSGSNYHDLCTLAVVQGEAQGGGFEAALSAHVLVAERGVHFGFPEGLFGMFPGMGGKQFLNVRAGSAIAREIVGSARRWTAEELFEIGVVDVLAESGQGLVAAKSFVETASADDMERLGSRLRKITLKTLIDDVSEWVEQAFTLSPRHLRTMDLIVEAQQRARVRRQKERAMN